MKRQLNFYSSPRFHLSLLTLAASLTMTMPALAASVTLATSPLATSTTSAVKPNVLLLLDNSGSMDWDHMPDDAEDGGSAVAFDYGYYGVRSSQCNQVYYDPTTTYKPPVYSGGTTYTDASFTAACANGFSGACSVNLNNSFKANQDGLGGNAAGTDTATGAYYYLYSGTQTTQLQKNYHDTANTFSLECKSALNTAPGNAVFSKRRLATTETTTITISGSTSTSVSGITVNGTQLMSSASISSPSSSALATDIAARINLGGYTASASGSIITITGPTTAADFTPIVTSSGGMAFAAEIFPETDATKLTNFANWYSFYRTRMLMMKTATGRAFSSLNNNYRVGLMKISQTNPVVYVNTFETTLRDSWYTSLYGMATSGSTPLRRALSDAGKYFAGKLTGTDPTQYSCQQNFTILSTDGYWNTGDGYKIDGSAVGNQDGTAARPMYDGSNVVPTWTKTYSRKSYSKVTSTCTGGKKKLSTQPQTGSCTTTTSAASCTPSSWSSGTAVISGSCSSTITLPSPNPSTAVLDSSVSTPGTGGGSSDNLADIAMYYYMTDLRTTALSNCGTPIAPATVGPLCQNNVFIGGNDNNLQQHMTTFTLGLGASGWMNYSSSYLTDTAGDYPSVKLGSTASSTVCTWQASGTVCNWPVPGMSG
ncbi:MAG: hypothetical protein C0406_02340, partial [Sideroxydans sp.]|nr:hypothetical protein [Sideroxydans sp.]